MLTATVERRTRFLYSVLALATCVVSLSCAPAEQHDLPAAVEEIEEETESFANFNEYMAVSFRLCTRDRQLSQLKQSF